MTKDSKNILKRLEKDLKKLRQDGWMNEFHILVYHAICELTEQDRRILLDDLSSWYLTEQVTALVHYHFTKEGKTK